MDEDVEEVVSTEDVDEELVEDVVFYYCDDKIEFDERDFDSFRNEFFSIT